MGSSATPKRTGAAQPTAADGLECLFVGTYTEPIPFPSSRGHGIYVFCVDKCTGALIAEQVVTGRNPSYLAVHPDGRHLYAVSEVEDGRVSAFSIDDTSGRLSYLNEVATRGSGPAQLSVDPTGRYVMVANYESGHWTVIGTASDGRLGSLTHLARETGYGPNPVRQRGPHAHMILSDPAGRHVLGCDLGLDRVMIWRLDDTSGSLISADPPSWQLDSGSGPRQVAYHPALSCVYVIKELNSTVTVFAYEETRGTLTAIQAVSTLPDDFTGASTAAHLMVHPSGKFLYASNRGHDSIATYSIDGTTGRLALVGHAPSGGRTPRSFTINSSGTLMYVANQDSDTIATLRIDQVNGALSQTNAALPTPSPACVVYWRAP
jgi:6-phosphogluconolactonase